MEHDRSNDEAAIRALIEGFVKALRAKDLDGVMSVYASDLVAFDVAPPLQYLGVKSFRKVWQEVFEIVHTIDYEIRDLSIVACDEVAFSHSLNRLSATMKDGQKTGPWVRWTACYRKTNGYWLIAHMQASVPVDIRTGKAATQLKP
jgi:uncharacterized protein (TIGR02246 family)